MSKETRAREVFEVIVLYDDACRCVTVYHEGFNYRIPTLRTWKPGEKLRITVDRLVPAKRKLGGKRNK